LNIWPSLDVAPELIEAALEEEMRQRAKRRSVDKVPMRQKASELFAVLRERIREIYPDVIELAEPKSVSYHCPAFFLEVLPRARRLNLLLALDFGEIEDEHEIAQDATEWKFFFHAQHEGGVLVHVREEEDIEKAMPIIRQAHSLNLASSPEVT
jgi:predicted transport protein